MGKEQDLISELCKKWGLAYGEAEIKRAFENLDKKNSSKKTDQAVLAVRRNADWNLRDGGTLSLTGLRGR